MVPLTFWAQFPPQKKLHDDTGISDRIYVPIFGKTYESVIPVTTRTRPVKLADGTTGVAKVVNSPIVAVPRILNWAAIRACIQR